MRQLEPATGAPKDLASFAAMPAQDIAKTRVLQTVVGRTVVYESEPHR
jgi:hypothetical protein